ncbi:DNA-binding protein [Sphingopyxis sp. PAMC25046]|nr:DNA-binding protein [Sphingopyxis sp. PAMC25046]
MPFQSPAPSPSSPLAIEPISMRIPDACRFTGISRSSLYLLIARGEVEIVKMGAATLVLTESLRDLIERQRGTSTSRTAAPIRCRSDQDEVRKSDRQSRSRRTANDFASIPLFERD